MKPFLCLSLGPTAGWAVRYRTGRINSGDVSLRANSLIDIMDPSIAHWWLAGIRKSLPQFDVIGVVDPPVPYPPRFSLLFDDWLAMTGALRERITHRQYKRATVGPYCTVRELLEWADAAYPAQHVQGREQATALAGLACLPQGEVPVRHARRKGSAHCAGT